MPRLAPTLVVVALLVGTGVAFALTERLKLERSPITDVRVAKVFSPVCRCPQQRAFVRFRLRRADRVTLEVLDGDGDLVRTVASGSRRPAGRLEFRWDGRDESGRRVRDGVYRPRVRLSRRGRTFLMPNPIRVDTVRPRFLGASVIPRVISPDGDGRREYVTARYEVTEPAKVYVVVNGKRRVESQLRRPEGRLQWFGRVGKRPVRAGRYRIVLVAEDRAGNRSSTRPFGVTVRYVDVLRARVSVRPRTHFRVRVTTYASSFRWRLARTRGVARAGVLRLRAPRRPGRYVLYVTVNGRADKAVVRVRRP